jgi:hypothetical protein
MQRRDHALARPRPGNGTMLSCEAVTVRDGHSDVIGSTATALDIA